MATLSEHWCCARTTTWRPIPSVFPSLRRFVPFHPHLPQSINQLMDISAGSRSLAHNSSTNSSSISSTTTEKRPRPQREEGRGNAVTAHWDTFAQLGKKKKAPRKNPRKENLLYSAMHAASQPTPEPKAEAVARQRQRQRQRQRKRKRICLISTGAYPVPVTGGFPPAFPGELCILLWHGYLATCYIAWHGRHGMESHWPFQTRPPAVLCCAVLQLC